MQQKIPTFEFVRQSFKQTLAFPKGLLVTVGAFVVMLMIVALLGALIGVDDGAGLPNAATGVGALLLVLAGILLTLGWIFNYWVRYGANGPEAVLPKGFSASLGPAMVTGLKLLFIGILLLVVASVVFLTLGVVGLAPNLEEMTDLAGADTLDIIRTVGFTYLVIFGAMCGIYSIFSANLTETALGQPREDIAQPHVLEFAIVLFLIYVALYAPVILVQSLVSEIVGGLLETVVSVFITAVIPVAHGLRYDWQRKIYDEGGGDN